MQRPRRPRGYFEPRRLDFGIWRENLKPSEGEQVPRTITVTQSHGAGEPFGEDKDWGPLIPYRFEAEGVEGEITWNRKPGSPGPKVGETLTGDISENEYGKKFKLARSGSSFGGGGRSPQETKRIERMAAHKVAVQIVAVAQQAGLLEDLNNSKQIVSAVAGIARLLEADLDA